MPELALPIQGYDDQVDPMGYALPVAQPIPADIPRIYIRSEPDVIPTRDEPILHTSGKQLKAVDHDPWANLGMAGVEDKSGQSEHPLLKQLFGLGGEERVQLWPERMVRAGVTAAGNVMSGQTPQWAVDPETGDVHTSPQMIEAGLDTAALAGTGGLAGTTEATLGSGPFLRPALKHNGKIYKGKEGQQHLDVLPKHLEADFNQKAMTGEDISHYNFGFMNHKGQFLNREAALDYAVKEGLVDPTAGQYGALTSTLLSDSSKPGIAIEAIKKNQPRKYMEIRKAIDESDPNYVYHVTNSERANQIADEGLKIHKPNEFTDQSVWPDNSIEKRNYFTSTPKNSWQFAPEEGQPSLLRIKKDSHDFKTERGTGDIYSNKKVSPKNIEYLNDEGKWVSLKADNEAGAALMANKPTFYSALEHNVNNIGQAKMTGDQWLGTLANKPGVKPEELQWTGLKEFLEENKGKPVTKEQIQEHLQNNKVELKEVVKGNEGPKVKLPYNRDEEGRLVDTSADTKYHSYQLPGGKNYREMLLTLPDKGFQSYYNKNWNPRGDTKFEDLPSYLKKDIQNAYTEETGNVPPNNYKSSHWDEPNILAHVRMNDRTIDGKKSLHLEEIQSDWHQQGREKGYKEPKNQVSEEEINKLVKADSEARIAATAASEKAWKEATNSKAENQRQWTDTGIDRHELRRAQEYVNDSKERQAAYDKTIETHRALNEAVERGKTGVPDAPFKKTWHELALKRMLREAAEKGYDRLSWTPGEAQAARYDLSKSVEAIQATKLPDGTFNVHARPKGDAGFESMGSRISANKLADIVGKELAEKITKQETDKASSYKGVDLKIGGEGMKGFYDKMIPNALEKMGKEHGVKVKSAKITEHEAFVGQGRNGPETIPKKENTVHYIDIPQSLKDAVLRKGQPLFSSAHPGVTFSQVDHDPWEKKNATKEK